MPRPNGVFKAQNSYQQVVSRKLYEDTPKAIFAALCVSLLANVQGVNMTKTDIDKAILEEWKALHENGLVPQKPPSRLTNL